MRSIYVMIAILLGIVLVGVQSDARRRKVNDPKRYENIWHGTSDWHGRYNRKGSLEMTITITKADDGQEISWEINGKILDQVDYEYLSGNLPVGIPFLCVYARDGENEHMFYGIL